MDDSLDQEIYRRVMHGRSGVDPLNKAKPATKEVARAVKKAIGSS